jgi:hypothetical protein
MIRKELFFRIAELANSAFSTDEKKRYVPTQNTWENLCNHVFPSCNLVCRFTTLCDDMMATVLRLDATLHAELSADIQKELNMELNRLRVGQRIKDAESAKVNHDRNTNDSTRTY